MDWDSLEAQIRGVRRLFNWLIVFVAAIFFLSCGAGDRTREKPPLADSLLITGVLIIDSSAGSVSQPRDIFIIGARIAEIAEPGVIPRHRAASVINGDGLFALPGLIDVHAHIGDGGVGQQSEPDRIGALTQFVRYGVTTIFAPGGGGGNDRQLAEWKKMSGELLFPGIYGSGAIITAPGGHPIGTIWNMAEDADPTVIYERGATAVAEEDDVDALLEQKKAMGVDAIKIVIEDGPGPWYPKPRLSRAKIAQLVDAAHRRGLRVFAHISTSVHLTDGVESGVDGVMHSAEDPIDDAILARMARQKTFYTPTLALYDGFFQTSAWSI